MATELIAALFVGALTVANLLVSGLAMIFGAFATASPRRAAQIWGSQRLNSLAPEREASFVLWYRVFGIFLFLGGVLVALEGTVFSKYHY